MDRAEARAAAKAAVESGADRELLAELLERMRPGDIAQSIVAAPTAPNVKTYLVEEWGLDSEDWFSD